MEANSRVYRMLLKSFHIYYTVLIFIYLTKKNTSMNGIVQVKKSNFEKNKEQWYFVVNFRVSLKHFFLIIINTHSQ